LIINELDVEDGAVRVSITLLQKSNEAVKKVVDSGLKRCRIPLPQREIEASQVVEVVDVSLRRQRKKLQIKLDGK